MVIGSRLGPYEILAKLGEGGMGEVYRARDTKLDRQVAIKILPEAFAADAERVARFQREAKTLATLNHPNIAHIHGFEDSNGVRALVMELVEGEDLAERIARGRIPFDDALPMARQIAEALEAAHEQGIVHRDLKPANIKLRPDGTVKVLDFGLAKALTTDPSDPNLSVSPTLSLTGVTRMGSVIGTASYMAPEQTKGRPVDRRADVWAFGAVLYEMLTGRRAFVGDDVSDTLVSVLRDDPDWSALPADVPASTRQVLRVCLQKDPKQRVRDMSAIRLALDGAFGEPAAAATTATPPLTRTLFWRQAIPWAMVLVVAAAAIVAVIRRPVPAAVRVERYVITTPPDAPVQANQRASVQISPDGSRVAYRTTRSAPDDPANSVLYLRELGQLEATILRGTEGVQTFFFSPDGQSIAFSTGNGGAGGALKRVSVNGGPAQTICAFDGTIRGGSWGPDGTIVFGTTSLGLRRVSAAGGEPQVLTSGESSKVGVEHWWPEFLPDGKNVLFVVDGSTVRPRIVAMSLSSGAMKDVGIAGSQPRFSTTGHLMYTAGDTLRTVRFDPSTLTMIGNSVTAVEKIVSGQFRAASYSLSTDGSMVYVSGLPSGSLGVRTLVWVDRKGGEEAVNVEPNAYTYARLSPDGTRVALDARDRENDIWIFTLATATLQRLTTDPGLDRSPVWTADSTRVAFSANREGLDSIYWQKADGSGAPERLSVGSNPAGPDAFSKDGRWLVFHTPNGQPFGLGILALEGDRKEQMLFASKFNEVNGDLSPDGRWLAYETDESGRNEIYVSSFPDVSGLKRAVSNRGGTRALWSKDGRELFYYVGPDTIMSVPVTPGATLGLGAPTVAVKGPYARPQNAGRHYDISRDGRRFLLLKDVTEDKAGASAPAPAPEIRLIRHWDEEMKRLAPAN